MQTELTELTQPETPPPPPAWKTSDTWIGLIILLTLLGAFLYLAIQLDLENKYASLLIVIPELLMLIPIAIIFAWRKVAWKELGFVRFKWEDIALGCGLLIAVYLISIANNLIMTLLGIVTQAEAIFEVLEEIESLAIFAFSAVILAPILEELFFRGFIFKGFREKYGWKVALVISSLIFSLFHGQVATLIPTFLLGALFAYLYQRTNSIFPGMILHFAMNAFGTCGLLVAYQFGGI